MKAISFKRDILPAFQKLVEQGYTPAAAIYEVLTKLAEENDDAR